MLRSKVGMSVSAVLLLGMMGISGCGDNNQGATGNPNVHTNSVRGTQDGRMHLNSARGTHQIDSLDMDAALSRRVAALKGVRSANVLMAGRSAYVAVTLDNGAEGGRVKGLNITPGTNGYGTGNGIGSGTGTLYPSRGTGMDGSLMDSGRALTGTDRGLPGTANRGGTTGPVGGVNGANGAGGLGRGVDGTEAELGGTADRSGIGAGNAMDTTDALTQDIKDKIADEVKKNNPQVGNVYVSANPDFVERVNGYADQVRGGHPLKGFVNEFRTMAERIFPANSGDNVNR